MPIFKFPWYLTEKFLVSRAIVWRKSHLLHEKHFYWFNENILNIKQMWSSHLYYFYIDKWSAVWGSFSNFFWWFFTYSYLSTSFCSSMNPMILSSMSTSLLEKLTNIICVLKMSFLFITLRLVSFRGFSRWYRILNPKKAVRHHTKDE